LLDGDRGRGVPRRVLAVSRGATVRVLKRSVRRADWKSVATFAYNAINALGHELEGTVSASDAAAAIEQLRLRGLHADRLSQVSGSAGNARVSVGMFRTIKPKSLQIFSRQFATMIEAGMNVVAALAILEQQTSDSVLAEVITAIREDVESGMLLSEAMALHPKVFSRIYVAMVEAGEAAGILDIVLDRVALQIEKEQTLKRRVKSAMVYPTITMTFAIIVLNVMLLFVVPIFIQIFNTLHGQLPTLTQYVLMLSNVMRSYWYFIFPTLGLTAFGLMRGRKTGRGREIWDTIRLRIPLKIGDAARKITLARFARTLSTLVAAGVDILKALEITAQASGNYVFEQALVEVRASVRDGSTIAQPLLENDIFPPMVSQMVRIGEETGELEKMLRKVADFYEEEVDAVIDALTSIIEPLMMIAVGAMVGLILISMYLPMFKMLKLVSNSG
jgi:type IV pilus assembly protein PilC